MASEGAGATLLAWLQAQALHVSPGKCVLVKAQQAERREELWANVECLKVVKEGSEVISRDWAWGGGSSS